MIAALAVAGCNPPTVNEQSFDPAAWQAAQPDQSTRAEMAADLVRSERLIGLTRAEVIALLGPPTATANFEPWDLAYALGPCLDCYMPIDPAWLVIRLTDDRASEARIIEG